jgi:hypothetical protein
MVSAAEMSVCLFAYDERVFEALKRSRIVGMRVIENNGAMITSPRDIYTKALGLLNSPLDDQVRAQTAYTGKTSRC